MFLHEAHCLKSKESTDKKKTRSTYISHVEIMLCHCTLWSPYFNVLIVTHVNKSVHKSNDAMHEYKLTDAHVYFSANVHEAFE